MVKNTLITLDSNPDTGEGNEGIFKALFNEDIIIQPNSEMAMQSVSINRSINIIDINSFNSVLEFQIQSSIDGEPNGLHTINLNEGNYSRLNVINLFTDIQNKMNAQLGLNAGKEVGTQIAVRLSQKEKVEFVMGQAKQTTFMENNNPLLVYNDITYQAQYLRAANANGNLGNHNIFSKVEFVKGCGLFQAQIRKFSNANTATNAGFILGLVENTPSNQEKLNNLTITEADLTYAVRTNTDNLSTSNYMFKSPVNTEYTDAGTGPTKTDNDANTTENDILEITLDKGILAIKKHVPGTPTTIYSETYDYGTSDIYKRYLPIIGIYGDNTTTRISAVTSSLDPYDSAGTEEYSEHTELVGFPIPDRKRQLTTPTVYNLIFGNIELANFLGFLSVNLNPSQVKTSPRIFAGVNLFSKNLGSNTYLVELLNIPLNSYHTCLATSQTSRSTGGGRKSILASIPVSERIINNSGQIQYEPNTLFYVSLNNQYPLNLRNIKARIISNDFSPIQTDGISEISILIREDA